MKLSLVTTSLSTQIKLEEIPLNALLKVTTSELAGLPSHKRFFMLNVKHRSCEYGRRHRRTGGRGLPGFSYMVQIGLKVLFFGNFLLFFRWSHVKDLIVLFFVFFCYFSGFFRCPLPLEIFLSTTLAVNN